MIRIIGACALLVASAAYAITDLTTLKSEADRYAAEEQFATAIHWYAECMKANPNDINSCFNCAICLLKIGRIDEAIALFEQLCLRLENPESVRYNIAYAYKTAGNLDTAITLYEALLAKNPLYEAAELALGFAYIQNGDFVRGWPQHSKSLKRRGKNGEQLRALLSAQQLAGKTVLLHYEGGLGDTLMFIRYAERIKQLGGSTLCMVQEQLIPLLSRVPYIDRLIPYATSCSYHYDAYASLMSMPAIVNDTEETFPATIPYLFADPQLVEQWRVRLASYSGIKIGICWQSDVFNDSSRIPIARRGIPLTELEPLLRNPDYTFFSLQRFDGAEQRNELNAEIVLITYPDLDTDHGCFMDTAALIKNLDLVVSIDSAVAHLAGALGMPTLLLLPYATDWRWIIKRTDSPWYPHHRIFKQPAPFDWHSVVAEIDAYLSSFSKKKDLP